MFIYLSFIFSCKCFFIFSFFFVFIFPANFPFPTVISIFYKPFNLYSACNIQPNRFYGKVEDIKTLLPFFENNKLCLLLLINYIQKNFEFKSDMSFFQILQKILQIVIFQILQKIFTFQKW